MSMWAEISPHIADRALNAEASKRVVLTRASLMADGERFFSLFDGFGSGIDKNFGLQDGTGIEKILKDGNQAGTIAEVSRSSKTIDNRVIIKFCDENAVIASFRDKNDFVYCMTKMP